MSEAVQFGRLERRGIALGRTGIELVLIGSGLLLAVTAVYAGGAVGLSVTAPVWLVFILAGTLRVRGRGIPTWMPVVSSWARARAAGRDRAASTPRPEASELRLPGLRRPLTLVDCPALDGALVVDPTAATMTGVVRVQGSGFVLDGAATREHKSAAWGRVLGGLCAQPQVVRVQVLTTLAPGGLATARRWWREHADQRPGGPAAVLADLVDATFTGSTTREHLVAVAVRNPRGHRRPDPAAIDEVAGQLASLADAMTAADLRVGGWLGTPALGRAVRRGGDPWLADDVPVHAPSPAGVIDEWDRWCTGTVWHATYWVAEWPRAAVDATFLQPLLVGTDAVRSISLIAEPVPVAEALRAIRRARAEYRADAAQRDRFGQVEDLATITEVVDLDRREAELVAGHGDLRFTGLVTVTAPTRTELDSACRAVEADAARAMCDLIRLVGQQGAAHLAAALPLARSVR